MKFSTQPNLRLDNFVVGISFLIRVFRLVSLIMLLSVLACSSRIKPVKVPIKESGYFVSYEASVQPILNRRCAVCHSCNDAPCQLDQTAFTGVDRGASDENVYADRLFSTDPTRLFIDGKTTDHWRNKGFFPVVQHFAAGDPRNLDESILFRLIDYRKHNPLPKIHFDAFGSRTCPNPNAFLSRIQSELVSFFNTDLHAALGMPYGLPALSDKDYLTIRDWLLRGAPGPQAKDDLRPSNQRQAEKQIITWESFLNEASPKQQLVSRYLFEHLFYAHMYFSAVNGDEAPVYYRLVRSRAAAPAAIDEIATRLPYDAPEIPFSYRLRPIEAAIVQKTHLPFKLSDKTLSRLRKLFLSSDWALDEHELPGYASERSANPFQTFAKIPARARYQFMLDNAEYMVASFIKGPVCRGPLALNVIDDHFFIFFLSPDADQSVTNPEFLHSTAKLLIAPFRPQDLFSLEPNSSLWQILELPVRAATQLKLSFYPYFKSRQIKYLKKRDGFYARSRPMGFDLNDIWNGNGMNPNAVLTVFRHHDTASVKTGAWGGLPKTSLVLDYPIFERMYYDLVASFDIFSDIKVQLASRLYMDDLRIEGEDLFLSFLPLADRTAVRNFWYRKSEDSINSSDYPFYGTTSGIPRDTQVVFAKSGPPVAEFISHILRDVVHGEARGRVDTLNMARPEATPFEFAEIMGYHGLEHELAKIGGRTGRYVANLPDLSYVVFHEDSGDSHVYTFVHNRAHYNVKYLFQEDARLKKDEDTLSVLPGIQGSHPNFFFDVPLSRAKDFLVMLTAVSDGEESFQKLIDAYGVRRDAADFWRIYDWLFGELQRGDNVNAGIIDLNRYENY